MFHLHPPTKYTTAPPPAGINPISGVRDFFAQNYAKNNRLFATRQSKTTALAKRFKRDGFTTHKNMSKNYKTFVSWWLMIDSASMRCNRENANIYVVLVIIMMMWYPHLDKTKPPILCVVAKGGRCLPRRLILPLWILDPCPCFLQHFRVGSYKHLKKWFLENLNLVFRLPSSITTSETMYSHLA